MENREIHKTAQRLYLAYKLIHGRDGLQGEVASFFGATPQALNNWEKRGISDKGAIEAATRTGFDVAWFKHPKAEDSMTPFATGGTAVRPGKIRGVVVLGRGSGGDMPYRIWDDGGHPAGETGEYAEVASSDPNAFIVEVVGDSMYPKYAPRSFALVEPGTAIDIEDDVLVRLANGQTMIKRLISKREGITLASYNEQGTLFYANDQISWMYYVAYPIPRKKIKSRV